MKFRQGEAGFRRTGDGFRLTGQGTSVAETTQASGESASPRAGMTQRRGQRLTGSDERTVERVEARYGPNRLDSRVADLVRRNMK